MAAQTLLFRRRNLPHWIVADRTYFVTIRLHGSLPQSVLDELAAERDRLVRDKVSESELAELQRRQFVKTERILDACASDVRWLAQPAVAGVVLESTRWFETANRCWEVYAATIMASHVHLVLRNHGGRGSALLDDLGQFKRHTAREANRILGRTGNFWAREDFDHWCRSEDKVVAAVRYTANNPVKAGLCKVWREWPWTRVQERWIPLAGLE